MGEGQDLIRRVSQEGGEGKQHSFIMMNLFYFALSMFITRELWNDFLHYFEYILKKNNKKGPSAIPTGISFICLKMIQRSEMVISITDTEWASTEQLPPLSITIYISIC